VKIFGDQRSGNCFKLKLACSLLGIEHEWVHVDILEGQTGTPEFLARNPNGKIPLLELADCRHLSESNAILNYLARDSALEPSDAFQRAQVQQWQFFEQYSHEPFIAVARFIALYQGMPEDRVQEYQDKQAGGHKALAVMEARLANSDYLVGERLSTADIALYAYTHVAHEGGFSLDGYPGICRWLRRVEAEPGYITMQE